MKLFVQGLTRVGPDPQDVRLNWRGGIRSCKWNKQALAILSEEYINRLQNGEVKHNNVTLQYDEGVVKISNLRKTIARRLERTRFHWKNANAPASVTDDGDDDDTMAVQPPRTPGDIARSQSTETRRRQRGLLVRIHRHFVLFIYLFPSVSTVAQTPESRREEIL